MLEPDRLAGGMPMKLRRLFGKGDEGDESQDDADEDSPAKSTGDKPGGAIAPLYDQDDDAVDEAVDDDDATEDTEGDTADAFDEDAVPSRAGAGEADEGSAEGTAAALDEPLDDDGPNEAGDEGDPDDEGGPVDEGDSDDEDDDGDEDDDEGDSDDQDDDGDEDDDDGDQDDEGDRDTGQVAFALSDWGARERQLLDNELAVNRIRYAWEAGDLVVNSSDEELVDELIALIEDRISLDLSADVEPVIYDIGDWPPGLDDKFAEELVEARVPHARGFREFTIGTDDEDRVDEIVERISREWETDQADADAPDDLDAQEVLSDLFLSADRLIHSPKDKSDAKAFEQAATKAAELPLPFGFEQSDWDALLADVTALGDLVADKESYEDDVMDAATNLRTRLRSLV